MADFKPGLEGVVAVETAIAAPDREGGALRYRGYDIEELVGRFPYENIWGLLVDNDIESRMPDPAPYEPTNITGNAPADLQAEVAHMSAVWGLKKLVDIDDQQAREDLGRISAQMMGIVARSAAVAEGREPAPDDVVDQGETAAEKFLLRWRGEANPDHVIATNVEFYSAVLLDAADVPPELTPAMFACSRVAGWSAHILEQKQTGRLFRPADRYVGPGPRSLSAV